MLHAALDIPEIHDDTNLTSSNTFPINSIQKAPSSLPYELLAHILSIGAVVYLEDIDAKFYAQSSYYWRISPGHGTLCSPLYLVTVSQVCRYWRDTANSTPSLWTNITISPLLGSPLNIVNTIPLFLERSRPHLLDIYVDFNSHYKSCYGRELKEVCHSLAGLLCPHRDRWRSVVVRFWDEDYGPEFLNSLSDSCVRASRLTSFELHNFTLNHTLRYTLGLPAPALTNLMLWGWHINWNSWISATPNLTTLEIGYNMDLWSPFWDPFFTLLRHSCELKKLALFETSQLSSYSGWAAPMTTSQCIAHSVQLLNLEEFSVSWESMARVVWLFRGLSMPALKNLTIKLLEADATALIEELIRPDVRLLRGLRRLDVTGIDCHPTSIHKIYKQLDGLQELCIPARTRLAASPSKFISPLLPDENGHLLLLALETLCVSRVETSEDRVLVLEAAQKRKEASFPLQLELLTEPSWYL